MRKSLKFILLIMDEVLIVGLFIYIFIYFGVNLYFVGIMAIILILIVAFIAYIFLRGGI